MIMQYLEIKNKHPEEILFYRLGDFYEMFFSDALTASRELDITLTGRDAGSDEKVPMCGVPYHAAENYIAKLIAKGYKVAICEQVEDAKVAKGLVRREVIRIITPGTILSESMLSQYHNNFIALLFEQDTTLYLSAADISTGEFFWLKCLNFSQLEDFLARVLPAELLRSTRISNLEELNKLLKTRLPNTVVTERLYDGADLPINLFTRHFPNQPTNDSNAVLACGLLLEYLEFTQKSQLTHINRLNYFSVDDTMVIDSASLRNLEISRNMRDGSKKDTLLSVVDFTCTAMGSRMLKKWLEYPLLNPIKINRRQDAIQELVSQPLLLQNCRENLNCVQDLERILTRIDLGTANARDLVALKTSLIAIPQLKQLFLTANAQLLTDFSANTCAYTEIVDLLTATIEDNPPLSVRDGGFIRSNYDIELDELRAISKDAKTFLLEMETREREVTGIKSLKIGFNKVFGYYIEITHANSQAAPLHYTRKQTLANAERYITHELKDFESKILGAHERIINIEFHLFNQIREKIAAQLNGIQDSARRIAEIDTLYSLAEAASRNNYIRPEITTGNEISIADGRHPVIEQLCINERYVPNDIVLNNTNSEILIITGPNMAGKSTYMRQTALLVLLAHTGSFIPATAASIGVVDKIFTRIGANDDLSTGQSTFMMEMNEVAHIIKNATRNSLIILDEIGRGTSTYDGMSIARAVLEYIKDSIHAKTLFATHYHELTVLEEQLSGVKNFSVAVKERGNDITFLHRIIPGRADKSYGIHVASLAGLPKKILINAREHLGNLETANHEPQQHLQLQKMSDNSMSSLFDAQTSETLRQLAGIDVLSLTPIEALNILYKLNATAKSEI